VVCMDGAVRGPGWAGPGLEIHLIRRAGPKTNGQQQGETLGPFRSAISYNSYIKVQIPATATTRSHSNYQIGPNRCKSDQIADTYYQNQDHSTRYKLKTVSVR